MAKPELRIQTEDEAAEDVSIFHNLKKVGGGTLKFVRVSTGIEITVTGDADSIMDCLQKIKYGTGFRFIGLTSHALNLKATH